ncbi:MAG: single-stranded DNA-binding protein [Candidatus Obscuribacterales bacterium]|nr:single-stranded DNA-binding protein [Candidatus Obscuribacterales bacterium]
MNNQLNIIGYVGQAPRVVSFADTGNKVVKFSIAVREFSNKEESTLWIDVDAWNGLGESIMKTVKKGREVMLTGRLAISIFTKEVNGVNTEVHKPVLKLSSFHLCGPKPAEDAPDGETAPREMERATA